MLAADLYYNILDGAGQGLAAAGCAPLNGAADRASAQAVVGLTQSPPPMLHNNPAAWADFGSQTLFLPGHGGGGDLQYAAVDGEFVKQCGSAAGAYPPEDGGGGGASQCKPPAADLVPQQAEGATARSLIPAVFLEPKCAAGDFMPEPAMAPVMDFMEAILAGSSSTSAASASSLNSFSANAGMQSHCWIP